MQIPPLVLLAIALVLPLSAQQPATPAPPKLKLSATADRADALYQVGETVTFTVRAFEGKKPAGATLTCTLSKDGVDPQPPQQVTLVDGQATVSGRLDEAGFLQLLVEGGGGRALAAAAFDPLTLQPSLPVPDDFDAFWQTQKKALAGVPLRAVTTPAESNVAAVEVFDVQVDCASVTPVSGYLAKPRGAKPKSLPALLKVHGAGVVSASPGIASWAAREGGLLAMDINAHGLPNGRPKAFYDALAAGELKDYRSRGQLDREQIYFKGMFQRLMRALDFLAAQPEWDGKTLIVYGSSQGGFQALAAAGLDERVTFICAGVPAGCDHSGMEAKRISGWPKLVARDAQGAPLPASLQAARYFDAVNFAARAKCQGAAVTVGFIDATCPPSSVYAAYNALPVPKQIHFDIGAGHVNTPAATAFMEKAALEHIRMMRER